MLRILSVFGALDGANEGKKASIQSEASAKDGPCITRRPKTVSTGLDSGLAGASPSLVPEGSRRDCS